jgi:hypothetical protein
MKNQGALKMKRHHIVRIPLDPETSLILNRIDDLVKGLSSKDISVNTSSSRILDIGLAKLLKEPLGEGQLSDLPDKLLKEKESELKLWEEIYRQNIEKMEELTECIKDYTRDKALLMDAFDRLRFQLDDMQEKLDNTMKKGRLAGG